MKPEGFCRLKVDEEFERSWLLHGQFSRLFALQYSIDIHRRSTRDGTLVGSIGNKGTRFEHLPHPDARRQTTREYVFYDLHPYGIEQALRIDDRPLHVSLRHCVKGGL